MKFEYLVLMVEIILCAIIFFISLEFIGLLIEIWRVG